MQCRQCIRKGNRKMYDIIVIGGGPAGISAAIYAVSRGKKTVVFEKNAVGGTVGKVSTVTHYSGIVANETGASFAARLKAQAEGAGVEIRRETVTGTILQGEVKKVKTCCGEYEARCVILANGTTPRTLGIPGEELKCANAAKDAPACEGRHVYVVGGADGAVKEAIYLSQFAARVTIIHFEPQLVCIQEFKDKIAARDNMDALPASRLHAIIGSGSSDEIQALEILNDATGEITRVEDPGCRVFIYAGSAPDTSIYEGLTCKDGYICVNESMETGIPGVFAAGDIRVKTVRQVATAVSDGAIAGIKAAAF